MSTHTGMAAVTDADKHRRDNWHGSPEVESVASKHADEGGEYHETTQRQDKAKHVAVKMLKGIVPALCGESWSGEDRSVRELTEPGYYPVGEGFMDHVENARVNETEGYVSQGESTWVLYHGSPADEFVFLIELWLNYAVDEGVISRDLADGLLSDAKSMKQGTDKTDQRIVELLAIDMQKGERSTPG
ncbi:hypothetical protein [Salinibaculum salinum]|uniref:hypothetical protein n=1 Tax=Salinibaculum salinum TaxID=3131996 RepID=UPI0030EBC866